MIDYFINTNHIIQALYGGILALLFTIIGSLIVFLLKKINKKAINIMLSISAGIMLSASIWSLLSPAIDLSIKNNINLIVILFGFILGCLFFIFGDIFIEKKLNNNIKKNKKWLMLIVAITLHNIPEGLAIGVAFGSLIYNIEGSSLISACLLALGIAIQSIPEGSSISVILRKNGLSNKKSFIVGSLSGIVEPISSVIGAILVLKIRLLLPIMLSFAAGAMIFVVVKDLIPESQENENKNLMTFCTMIGFISMMFLDIIFS